MSLAIDHLHLRLPAAMAPRAHGIAVALGDALAALSPSVLAPATPLQLAGLRLPALHIDPGASDAQIAAGVAGQLRRAMVAAACDQGWP